MSTQTKADQLAQDTYTNKYHTLEFAEEVAAELRRLSPMEAERDKLLAVNKVLVDSSKDLLYKYAALVNCGDCGNCDAEEEEEVIAMREALKLAGEIK